MTLTSPRRCSASGAWQDRLAVAARRADDTRSELHRRPSPGACGCRQHHRVAARAARGRRPRASARPRPARPGARDQRRGQRRGPQGRGRLPVPADPAWPAETSPAQALRRALRAAGARAGKRHSGVLVAIDEAQELDPEAMADLGMLAQTVAHGEGHPVAIAVAGTPELSGQLLRSGSFLERMPRTELGMLSRDEARLALLEPANARGVIWEESGLNAVCNTAGGYPYFVQLGGHHAWEQATAPDRISAQDALSACRVINDNADRMFRDRWAPARPRPTRVPGDRRRQRSTSPPAEVGRYPPRRGDAEQTAQRADAGALLADQRPSPSAVRGARRSGIRDPPVWHLVAETRWVRLSWRDYVMTRRSSTNVLQTRRLPKRSRSVEPCQETGAFRPWSRPGGLQHLPAA